MFNINSMKRIKESQAGFTFIELLIASVMSLVVLGLLAHVFRSQQKEFGQQTGLNTLQANGRAATEVVARSVQNAGFNVNRGTRFLTASDHYLTAVYDANNDNVIQNDEVMTYVLANAWDTASLNHPFTARFDENGNGVVESGEAYTIPFQMTTAAGPPFNLYKVIPTADGTGITRSLVARNIDNMVIKYYDRNGELLPKMNDTNKNGTGTIAFDANDDGVPDSGNWDFTIPTAELNDIRKVEIEVLARSRKTSAREVTTSGSYLPGSLAARTSGSANYSDKFIREDFTAEMAPRNLVLAPWGSIDVRANPMVVNCPGGTFSSITATLLDANGDSVTGPVINFTATSGATLSVASDTANGSGEGTTNVSYNFADPFTTTTVSASANITDVNGIQRPIFSAAPVTFSYGTAQGGFRDEFDGTQTEAWTPHDVDPFTVVGEEAFSSLGTPNFVGTLNGCSTWSNYAVQTNVKMSTGSTWLSDDYAGVILRRVDSQNYYWVGIFEPDGESGNNAPELQIRRVTGGVLPGTLLAFVNIEDDPGPTPHLGMTLAEDIPYTIKAQISGNDIRVKFWQPADPNDPNVDEPLNWSLPDTSGTFTPVTDATHTAGEFGLGARDDIFIFDNVVVTNADPI